MPTGSPPGPTPTPVQAQPEASSALAARWAAAEPLLRASADPVALTDLDARVVGAHSAAWLAVGERALDAIPLPDRAIAELAFKNVVTPGIGHTIEVPIQPQGSATEWYRVSLSPVRGALAVEGVLWTFANVGPQRRELDRLRRSERLLVDTQGVAHLGTWEWDLREPHATWSAELYRIYGLDPSTHVPSYHDYLARIHPDDRQQVVDATERVLQTGERISHDERVYRPDGSLRWLHTWAEAVVEDGRIARLVGVCLDITERKAAELELEARAREKDVLLREIHHRVKNNLQVVASLLNLQAVSTNDKRLAAALEEARARVRSMALVHQALDKAGNLSQIDLGDYVKGLALDLSRAYGSGSSGVKLEVHTKPLLVGMDHAVNSGLVINELISNAFKHAFPSARAGTVRVEVSPREDGGATIVVADDGIGTPRGIWNAPSSTLGLRLVRALVKQMDARLTVNNANGTHVRIDLPASAVVGR